VLQKCCVAEFIGTFVLVFAGTGAIIINALTGEITSMGIALTFGFTVAILIYCLGNVSGAHLNPAVTVALTLTGKLEPKKTLPYIASQFFGSILASLTLLFLFGKVSNLGATQPRYGWQQSFVLEFILTFILMFVIMAVVMNKHGIGMSATAIGTAVGLDAMFGGPISGASMNPARSLGPALVSATFHNQWIYLIAPLGGAILAAFLYKLLLKENDIGLPIEKAVSSEGMP
jgi:aquaporin NIP